MKTALITGVSGNVGSACAAQLLFQNWNVIGVSRSKSNIDHKNFRYSSQDVNNINWVSKAKVPPVSLVILAHGTQEKMLFKNTPSEKYLQLMHENIDSVYFACKSLSDKKLLKRGSLIIFSSSIQATQPRAGRGPYSMAKAAIEALTKTLAIELAPNTRTIALRMGQLTTSMKGIHFSQEQEQELKKLSPGRWPTPLQIASLCENLYYQLGMTGSIIDIDSGHHLSIWGNK